MCSLRSETFYLFIGKVLYERERERERERGRKREGERASADREIDMKLL